jgi:uncharacterized protein (DUF2126 family)
LSYSLKVQPEGHFINWQQDPQGNYLARLVFPEKAQRLRIEVDLVAEMVVFNPFDFFLEPYAAAIPFTYAADERRELSPYLEKLPLTPRFAAYLETIDRAPRPTVECLVALNQRLSEDVRYLVRMEPGVQTPEQTLELARGSCRDSTWLLVQLLRNLGLASRFVSGYLIQLTADVKALGGPSGTDVDFTDLHAWCEVYLPGAGWVGLDATSGMLAGEGHIPLACSPDPNSAAPITGRVEPCECEFSHTMSVTRIHEAPRVTRPYDDAQWEAILALGKHIDADLVARDVRLTMGGQPTFVAIEDRDGAEWNTTALGPTKKRLATELYRRLVAGYARGALMHMGQGEQRPFWSLAAFWRADGEPVWRNARWTASEQESYGVTDELAARFLAAVAERSALPVAASPREGRLYVAMPALDRLEDYLALVGSVEAAAEALRCPVILEGHEPPRDPRLVSLRVTPGPGVIAVSVQPSASWAALVEHTECLYEQARLAHLSSEKFLIDGRHTGTGGGNHVVLGGATPADSPFLRRPDLLRSFIGYWNDHPSLSYLFSGLFIGPDCQAPRVDEARPDSLYELEIAFAQMRALGETVAASTVDGLLRHLLTDISGNPHRAEFCIDKLYAPDSASGRQGLLTLRAFEMPPHARMSLAQQLLLRGLVVRFWQQPYAPARLTRWGTALHDRFLLPHFIAQDFTDVLNELAQAGYAFKPEWFAPHLEFRFPKIGDYSVGGMALELRRALEPWRVLSEEGDAGGMSRYDASLERLQVMVSGMAPQRYLLTCNGLPVPLQPTGRQGEFVAAVRYQAWPPANALQPAHAPLTFDLVDTWAQRSLGGCQYHVAHPGGRIYETVPVNANEAESRRLARFFRVGHTPGDIHVPPMQVSEEFPLTLDLRRFNCSHH